MPWTRLDDLFAQHPKMQAAGPLGLALQTAALCYCNQYLTDGFVPRDVAAKLLRFDNIDLIDDSEHEHATRMNWQLVVDRLVAVGAWDTVEGGWSIHDFDKYQPTREQVLAEREASRKRQLKLRKSRRDNHRDSRVNSEEVQGPRTRSSSKEELRVQRRSKTNDAAAVENKERTHAGLLDQANRFADAWNGADSAEFATKLDYLEVQYGSRLSALERDTLLDKALGQ
jgi:hypothetical protein